MPDLGGMEATEQIGQHCPGVRVLVLTRHSNQGHLRRLLQAGAHGYLVKKTAPAELIVAIRSVAAGGTYLDPTLAGPLVASIARSEPREAQPASSSAGASPAGALTLREQEVLRLIAWGLSAQEIATQLSISAKTVDYHKARASEKLGLRSRTDIVRYALSQGWLQLEEVPDEP
jgi:DNA-binding NarL/FixJ family response regulator